MRDLQSRLKLAGIPISCPPSGVPIATQIPLRGFFAPPALRWGQSGDIDELLKPIREALGVGVPGIPSSLICAAPVPAHDDLVGMLLKSAKQSERPLLALFRTLREPRAREVFRAAVARDSDQECFEGALGLCAIGVTEEDRPALVAALRDHSDSDRQCATLAPLVSGGLLESALETLDLDSLVDSVPLIEPLIEIIESGDPSSLLELIQSGSLTWQKRIPAYYILGDLAEHFASSEYLDALLECAESDDDSDSTVMLMYATGQVVRHIGYEAAKRVLKFSIEDLGSGSTKQCVMINAAYRAELDDAESAKLCELINTFDESDSDTQRALGRALNVFLGECDLTNWVSSGGYGKNIDLYDPFYADQSFRPQALWSLYADQQVTRASARAWLSMVSRESVTLEFSALSSAMMAHSLPEVVPLLEGMLKKSSGSDQTRSGLAAALLFAERETSLSPTYLRCLLNQENTGGPVEETPAVIGELLYYSERSETQLVARELMRSLSESGRAICAGFLNASLREERYGDERERLLFSLGFPMNSSPTQDSSPDLKLAIGEDISTYEITQLLASADDDARDEMTRSLLSSLKGDDRSRDLSLARDTDLWRDVAIERIQSQLLQMARGGWVQREVACVFTNTLGDRAISGALGSSISEMIQRLCNDSDSDVHGEARRAASTLGLSVLIVNAENIIQGITSSDERDAWTERLYAFIKSEDERSEILTLCRATSIWSELDQDTLSERWLEFADGGWVGREAAAVLIMNHDTLLIGSRAERIRDRLLELRDDNDSDVQREAKAACVALGIE